MKKNMICISGNIAVGKTEVAKIISEELNYKLYRASDYFRELSRQMNMDLVTFNEYVENNPDIDKSIENNTKQVVEKENNIVIDARLGFLLSGTKAFRVYMVASKDVAASRLFEAAKTRGKEEKYKDVESVLEAIDIRENSEHERYLKLYGVDVHDESNYDYVIDTTTLNSKQVAEKIINAYNVWNKVDFSEG